MISLREFVSRVVKKLDEVGIPYMISGSFASSVHGEPRATNDVDVVIAPTVEQLNAFVQSLGNEYYVDSAAAQEAFRTQTMFNVVDHQTGWKIDLILLKKRAYSQTEFQRRRQSNFTGLDVYVVSPEDAILSKLEWSKEAESERQYRDALGVAAVQWERLDKVYLRKWASELHVENLLEKIIDQAQELQPPK